MLALEHYTPTTKTEAEKFVRLQSALTQLGVVRALLKDDGWKRYPFDQEAWPRPIAPIGRRVYMTVETDFPSNGLFVIEHRLSRTASHEVAAYSDGYQSISKFQDANMGGQFCVFPNELLTEQRAEELDMFAASSELAFKYITKKL